MYKWCNRRGSGEDSNGPSAFGFNDSIDRFVNRCGDLSVSCPPPLGADTSWGYSGVVTPANKDMHAPSEVISARTGVFAKEPVPGQVKTRLEPLFGPILGPAGPAELAEALLRDAAHRLDLPEVGLELVFAPQSAEAWFQATFPKLPLRGQRGAELGARMANWFYDALKELPVGGTAVAVGADSPWTSSGRVQRAHELLRDGADVVLGPDVGGGYYLVGMRAPRAGLFLEIAMSTGDMFAATCEWVRSRGLRLELLEVDYDLDVAEDWQRLVLDLETPRKIQDPRDWPSHLAAFAARVQNCTERGEASE